MSKTFQFFEGIYDKSMTVDDLKLRLQQLGSEIKTVAPSRVLLALSHRLPEYGITYLKTSGRPAITEDEWQVILMGYMYNGHVEVIEAALVSDGTALKCTPPGIIRDTVYEMLRSGDKGHIIKPIIPYVPWFLKGNGGFNLIECACGLANDQYYQVTYQTQLLADIREWGSTLPGHKYTKFLERFLDITTQVENHDVRRCINILRVGCGWLTPEGLALTVAGREHYSAISQLKPEHPIAQHIAPFLKQLEDFIREEGRAYFASIPEGEHSEPHNIEIWESSMQGAFSVRVSGYLASKGWLRIGYTSERNIEISGTTDGFEKCRKTLSIFLEAAATTYPTKKVINHYWVIRPEQTLPDSPVGLGELLDKEN